MGRAPRGSATRWAREAKPDASAAERENGPVEPSGRARAAARASRRFWLSEAPRVHGNVAFSSHSVAKYSASESARALWKAAAFSRPAERALRRRIGLTSPLRAARMDPGSSARSAGLRSPASRIPARPGSVSRAVKRRPVAEKTGPEMLRPRSRAARRARSRAGAEVAARQAPPAHSSSTARDEATRDERWKASGPSGSTTESRSSDSTRSGWAAA